MNQTERSNLFIEALQRQVERKSLFVDGVQNENQNPLVLIASIAEELGEAATDYARQREYGTIAECLDIAHSAMLLAIVLDKDGEVLKRTGW